MKTLLTMTILLASQIVFAANVANYSIEKGTLHKGGKARVEVL